MLHLFTSPRFSPPPTPAFTPPFIKAALLKQGQIPQVFTSEELNAKAQSLGLDKVLGPGPLQTAPWNQLHALLPQLLPLDNTPAPVDVETDTLAAQMFNKRYCSKLIGNLGYNS